MFNLMGIEDLLLMLMATYGLCFAIQHKLTFLHKRIDFFDRMFACTYCTGFHCGWIMYLLMLVGENFDLFELPYIIMFCFASSVFCYTLDEFIKYLESKS